MSEKKISLIFGKRGAGKSYLAADQLSRFDRVVIFDTLGEYKQGVIFDSAGDLARFWKTCYRGKFRLIYRPTRPAEEFDAIAKLVWECGDLCFLVEEIDCFGSTQKIPEHFANIIQRGRHKNITLIGVTQRPYGIHRLLTSQAKEICVFNTNEPRDREYLRLLLGQEIDGKLDQLKEYEFIRWEDSAETMEIQKV